MPLPSPNANESVQEIPSDLYAAWNEARNAMDQWKARKDQLQAKILEIIGDNFAATVDGQKVITNRPSRKYAEARIRSEHPDLVEHFLREQTVEVFDIEAFVLRFPQIAEQYRVRQFRIVGE